MLFVKSIPAHARALVLLLPLAVAAPPQILPADGDYTVITDDNTVVSDDNTVVSGDDTVISGDDNSIVGGCNKSLYYTPRNDGHCERSEAIQKVTTTKNATFVTAPRLSSNDTDTVNQNDDIIVMDGEDFEITVTHRAAAPLSPSSRIIKASEFRGKFADLPSVLESVSGIDIRSTGGYGQYAESSIRGGTALGARVYLDGVLLNGASVGAADLSKIPIDKITEIRVTKSASGLRQMGAGMGGVIELFTTDGDTGHNITSINVEAGSFGYLKGGAIIKRDNGGNAVIHPASPTQNSGLANAEINKLLRFARNDVIARSEATKHRVYRGISQSKKPQLLKITHQINVDVSKSDNDYPFVHDNGTTIPTLRDPDPTWDDTVMRKSNNYYKSFDAAYSLSADINERHKITRQINVGAYDQGLFAYHYKDNQSGSTSGNTVIYGIDYQGEISSRLMISGEASGIYRGGAISDPDGHFGLGGAKEITSNGASADFLIDARYSFTENFYMAGLTGARYDGYAQESKERSEKPEMSRYEYRAGAEAVIKAKIGESSITETALRAVYKYEIDTSTAPFNQWSTVPQNYRLGYPVAEAVFKMGINPVTLQLCAVASKRSPTFFERFGWSGGFISNPDLREETRMEVDAGASINMGEYGASASVFAGKVGDKIKSIPYSNSFVKVMNFADTRFYGAEVDINTKPLQIFTIELSAAYLKSIIDGAADPNWINRFEPFVPELSGFLKTEVDIWKINVGHGIKYESACYLNIENIVKRPRQIELSAWASYKPYGFLSLRYRVDNYLNTASFDFLDNPKPKRTHTVSAALNV